MRIIAAVIGTALVTATVTAGFVAVAQERDSAGRQLPGNYAVAGIDARNRVWLQSTQPGPTKLVVCWQASNNEVVCNIEQAVQ